jgi:DNA-binding PadR family transcriptional regulator
MTERWHELSEFQRDVLRAVRRLEVHEDTRLHGLAIKRELQRRYGREVNTGQLYPNLDQLVDAGLLAKRPLDGRTNGYQLTERGRDLLERELAAFATDVGIADHTEADS